MVNFLSRLGQVWVYASHDKHHGFGREHPTFGDEMISINSYCFQFFPVSTYNNRSVVSIFVIFRGSFGHLYALTEFSMHFMCIIEI